MSIDFSHLEEQIRQQLAELSPLELSIVDQSHLHTGHGADGAHVALSLVSASFAGQGMVARHRMVYELLAKLIPNEIHALSINALSPEEQAEGQAEGKKQN